MKRSIATAILRSATSPLTTSGILSRPFATVPTHSPTPDVDLVIIGAGVIGLAIARHFCRSTQGLGSVLIIERAAQFGTETSSRNSEVIHAGIYYPPNSLKAKLCVRGKKLLYDYCAANEQVVHQRIGKLLVATSESQIPKLKHLQENASKNGVVDLQWLSAQEACGLEPAVACAAAVLSPSTGIIDSHAYMASLEQEIESLGGTIAYHSRVEHGSVDTMGHNRVVVRDVGGGDTATITARHIVNAAGLHAQKVASSIRGIPTPTIPPLFLAKGNYFLLRRSSSSRKPPFSRLIYPLPEPGGLGVHVTLDTGGGVRFGPNVTWLPPHTDPESIDYAVDPGLVHEFEASIRSFYPALPANSLDPGYSGVRPKLSGPDDPPADFLITSHGGLDVVSLFGIESPGLTASLAIAEVVVDRMVLQP